MNPGKRLVAGMVAVSMVMMGCHATSVTTDHDAKVRAKGAPAKVGKRAICDRLDANRFRVTIPTVQSNAVKQKVGSQWCWAACAETVLGSYGIQQSQEEIAAPFVGEDTTIAVSPLYVMRALNPDLEPRYRQVLDQNGKPDFDEWGRMASVSSVGGAINSDWLIEQLSKGEPAIVGLHEEDAAQGHLCVIYAATYSQAADPDGLKGWFVQGLRVESSTSGMPKNSRAQGLFWGTLTRAGETRIKPRFVLHSIEVVDPDPDTALYRTVSAADLQKSMTWLTTRGQARIELIEMMDWHVKNAKARARTTRQQINVRDGGRR